MWIYGENVQTRKRGQVEAKKVYELVGGNKRKPFDPQTYDIKKRYAYVDNSYLVRFVVLAFADSKAALQSKVYDESGEERHFRKPARNSLGCAKEALKSYLLVEEKEGTKEDVGREKRKREEEKVEKESDIAKKFRRYGSDSFEISDMEVETSPNPIAVAAPPKTKKKKTQSSELHKPEKEEQGRRVSQEINAKFLKEGQTKQKDPQLDMVLKQLEEETGRCEKIETKLEEMKKKFEEESERRKKLQELLEVMVSDIADIKKLLEAKHMGSVKVCKIKDLRDVAPDASPTYEIPEHHVHIGNQEFISKHAIAQIDKSAIGLRQRLLGLSKLFWPVDLHLMSLKKVSQENVTSLIAILRSMTWRNKNTCFDDDHVRRELGKALSMAATEVKNKNKKKDRSGKGEEVEGDKEEEEEDREGEDSISTIEEVPENTLADL
ncbi:hypothetical protein ONE63_008162 [Megalurothrips usitatus]|uniref:Uncharacterized protein n=1 Tax=Megalurothrips usitatus TaxID=439358 RepID=A0AAV7XRV4_9NEOP|nr:hypothetical protein ONE63_008162 [Megalurothrips usitatus]